MSTLVPALLLALADAASGRVFLRLEHLSNCGNWRLTIYESGDARGDLFNACHAGGPKTLVVRQSLKAHISALRATVAREHLLSLDGARASDVRHRGGTAGWFNVRCDATTARRPANAIATRRDRTRTAAATRRSVEPGPGRSELRCPSGPPDPPSRRVRSRIHRTAGSR